MPVVIMKFGGSCLVDAEAFQKIYDITMLYKDYKKVYVASAFNGITDLLLKTAKNLEDAREVDKNVTIIEKKHMEVIEVIFEDESSHQEHARAWVDKILRQLEDAFEDIREFGLEPSYIDLVSGYGEVLSTYILCEYLKSKGLDSVYIPANKLIITDDKFNNAYPLYDMTNARVKNKMIPAMETQGKDFILCVTGFIGRNKMGYTTTLGRGGSDYTATILAHSLYEVGNDKDIRVILWKDVDGLLAINPKYVPNSALIRRIDYAEAKEIANFGAKVLHPKCLESLEKNKIPLEIRNFDKPDDQTDYTKISEVSSKDEIKGISAVEDATIITIMSGSMVNVPGVLGKIFKIMGRNKISVSLVSQSASEISTSFVIAKEHTEKALSALKESEKFQDFYQIRAKEAAIINITGAKILENKPKAMIFQALAKQGITVRALSQSYDELNMSLVVDKGDLVNAIQAINADLCADIEGAKCSDN